MKKTLVISIIFLAFLSLATLTLAEWVQNQTIILEPTNEGYISYNSGIGTYTRHSPWTDLVTQLHAFNDGGNNNGRIYLEFNISHYLPVDANVTMMNLTYTTGQTPIVGPTVGCSWTSIDNMNGNSTNTSSPESIWRALTSGPALNSAQSMPNWFAPVPELFNRSTLGNFDVNHEGWWLYDGIFGAVIRNIRNITMQNISTSQDRVQIGFYVPIGATAAAGYMNSSISVLNTSLGATFRGPVFYTNVTFNRSMSNWTNFTNGSQQTITPIVYFNVNNSNGTAITYYVMVRDITAGTGWVEERLVRRASNGTQSVRLYNASAIGHEYEWFYVVVNGTKTPYKIYNFSIEVPTNIAPPSNIVIIDVNSQYLLASFTKYSYGMATINTVCYYQEGTLPPAYGSGTLAFNTSAAIPQSLGPLSPATTYTFAFWSYLSFGTYHALSSWSENLTNTTFYGEVTFVLRYENISTAGAYNELVNLSNRSWGYGEHQLIIHYTNASSSIYNFTNYTYRTHNYNPNQTLSLHYQPLFYEFTWNYSTLDASNFTSQYTRLLTPLAETSLANGTNITTFYLTTNKHVYNQYYTETEPTTGETNYTLNEDINNLVDYSFLFEDLSGYFSPSNSYNTITSIFTYVGTEKHIIDQRYIDAAAKINPTLNYHSYYYVGLNSTLTTSINEYYQNLGLVPTERTTSPYTETITIYSLSSDTQKLLSNISYSSQWMSNGFYFNYTDTSSSTTYLTVTIFNVTNNTFQYLETQWANGTSDYDFHYTTTNPWHDNISYRVFLNFTYTFSSGYTSTFTLPGGTLIFKPTGNIIITNTTINGIFTLIFGASPFYHPDTNYFVQYADIIIMLIGIFFLLSFTGTGNAVLGIGSQGIFYLIMTFIISGISIYFAVLGVFLLIIAALYAIRNSGGPKE